MKFEFEMTDLDAEFLISCLQDVMVQSSMEIMKQIIAEDKAETEEDAENARRLASYLESKIERIEEMIPRMTCERIEDD